jgi:hypothetical protein
MTPHLILATFFFATTLAAWLVVQRERQRLAELEQEYRRLKVRHQHACHLITVLQARLAARDAGPGREPRWFPRQ